MQMSSIALGMAIINQKPCHFDSFPAIAGDDEEGGALRASGAEAASWRDAKVSPKLLSSSATLMWVGRAGCGDGGGFGIGYVGGGAGGGGGGLGGGRGLGGGGDAGGAGGDGEGMRTPQSVQS